MRRIATAALLALAIACIGAVQPARAQQLLFDYVGFDFENPDVDAANFGGIGDGYVGLGEVPFLDVPAFIPDPTKQYLYHLTGLVATTRVLGGSFAIIDYSEPGTLTVYEDSDGFDYANPASFTNGTAILVCTITDFRLVLDTSSGSGSYDSVLQVTGGSLLPNLPANQIDGWQFAGITASTVTIPPGYVHQVDGQTFLQPPTHSVALSWGRLKRTYR